MAADLQIAQAYTDPTVVYGEEYVVNIPPRECTKTGRIEHRFR